MSADGGAALTDQKFGDRRQARADIALSDWGRH